MAYNVYWEDVEVGQEIPDWSRQTDFMHWNRYAAINDEFVYIHMDDDDYYPYNRVSHTVSKLKNSKEDYSQNITYTKNSVTPKSNSNKSNRFSL